jgi:phosphoribosylformimino-5-aminoimidazole carboxamide ribotide isomerase
MEIIPAVDLKGGKCVRLYQGDYKQETVFSDDPVSMAVRWQSLGATRLHIVDLDGAAQGTLQNRVVVDSIVKQVHMAIQLGGGIRDETTVERLLGSGIARVILGTVAIEKPKLVEALCSRFSDALIVGIDARDGYVATHGWLENTKVTALDLGKKMAEMGVKRILYTDIKRDGTLTEPNYEMITGLMDHTGLPVIAAGGISQLAHLEKLKAIGVEAAILGKALYTNAVNLTDALEIAGKNRG